MTVVMSLTFHWPIDLTEPARARSKKSDLTQHNPALLLNLCTRVTRYPEKVILITIRLAEFRRCSEKSALIHGA